MTIQWEPTTEEKFWEMLGCVPPASRAGGGFLVGEAYDHNSQGRPTFQAYKEDKAGAFWASSEPITFQQFKAEFPGAEYYYE